MALGIFAEFIFGTYQGRDAAGSPERWPSPARLHSALTDAGFALSDDGETLSPSVQRALRWFEGRPPTAIRFPDSVLAGRETRAYRDKGLVSKHTSLKTLQAGFKTAELASRTSALSGQIVYLWEEEPGDDVVAVIDELCAEVPYLGERPSAVRLFARSNVDITHDDHVHVSGKFISSRLGTSLGFPLTGRLNALIDAHARQYPAKFPSASNDAPSVSEIERFAPLPGGTASAVYVQQEPEPAPAPWLRGVLIEGWAVEQSVSTDARGAWSPSPNDYVTWATALHRALIKQLAWDVPPFVTGKYAPEAISPPNHLAIQIIPAGSPVRDAPLRTAAFLVLVPQSASAAESARVMQAIARVRSLFVGRGGRLELHERREIDPLDLWRAPAPGLERWWSPSPVMVAESRGGHAGALGQAWTLADAVRLSIGFVWRTEFDVDNLRGPQRAIALSSQVHELGIKVEWTRREVAYPPHSFVHKTNGDAPVVPIRTLIRMPELIRERQAAVIGQSRHFGTGLLLPVDAAPGSISASEKHHVE